MASTVASGDTAEPGKNWSRNKHEADIPALLPNSLHGDTLAAITSTMCDAFSEDPSMAFYFRPLGGVQRRPDLLQRFFSAIVRVAAIQGIVLHYGDCASAVLWFPPGVELLSNIFRTGLWKDMLTTPLSFLKRTIFDYTLQADKAKAKFLKSRESKKYYYVQLAGTRKSQQGKGLLKHSMLPVLRRADEEGVVCYLEATRAENVPIYERFGFQVTDGFDLVDSSGRCHIYCMAREPVMK